MAFCKRSTCTPAFIILNILRMMTIISLLAVVAASVVMLIKTFVVSKFYFFDGVSHVITAVTSTLLIFTELGIFSTYTLRSWPLLSESSSLVTLGMLMVALGVNILSNLNNPAINVNSIGLSSYRTVISSGILAITFGCTNIVASYIFRTNPAGVTARMIRSYGAEAANRIHESKSHAHPRLRSFHLGRDSLLPFYNPAFKSAITETQHKDRDRSDTLPSLPSYKTTASPVKLKTRTSSAPSLRPTDSMHRASSIYSTTTKSSFSDSTSLGHSLPSNTISPDINQGIHRSNTCPTNSIPPKSRVTRYSDFVEQVLVIAAPSNAQNSPFFDSLDCGKLVKRPDTPFLLGDCGNWI